MRFPFLKPRDVEPADPPTTRRVQSILRAALAARASDVHVSPAAGGGVVRFRVDGHFREHVRLPEDEQPRVVARLKVLAGLSVFRTAEPQDGGFRFEEGAAVRDFRLSTVPVLGGEQAVVRVFDGDDRPRTLGELGLDDAALAAVRRLVALPAGAVFVVGPCSSGKTTTLHAMARAILDDRGDCTHVVAVEDPVEQRLAGMTQVEVDPARGLTFPRALTALLRQDPEVLLVGETRDAETARVAVEAAFTGHLMLSSLHVGAAEEVPRRLALMGVPEYLVVEAVRGVVSQRLLRRRCADCEARGCGACSGSGHRGRFAVAEVSLLEGGACRLLTPTLAGSAACARDAGLTTDAELRRVLGDGRGA